MDEEKDVGQAGRGADAIEGDKVDKLDGKIRDNPAGAVNVFTNEGTTMGLPVLGVCTADGRCGAQEATSELETAKGRLDESVSEVDGRDNTRDRSLFACADAKSGWSAPAMEAVKVSTDKAGDDKESWGMFA